MIETGGSETILLVEDQDYVRRSARRILERAGYRVVEAAYGDDALAAADRLNGPLELLLTDVVMPGMSGRKLAARIAERRPEARILYMSGYTDDAMDRHGVSEQPIRLVPKPFRPNELLRAVRETLDEPTPAACSDEPERD